MSLKGLELQIAIPKTFDAGKIAEQKQQQSQLNQDFANALTERQTTKTRETVLGTEAYAKTDGDGGKTWARRADGWCTARIRGGKGDEASL